ncbi:class I SAM-dependent methyltransferase [Chitinispirillales bacterium ANBcel5]|uniref:class I SAM-dependent methyltransferase n=1 Tax=Cellulosispirillum alkaliphilum TaxID=3039283 RepID=UPI002A584E06|nr:class I SAM-dependent methyltransferase [Chitinispirillales bacterium ANBcel5]
MCSKQNSSHNHRNKRKTTSLCPLCRAEAVLFYSSKKRSFYRCTECRGIFCGREFLPDNDEEYKRYCYHNNDVLDPHYQSFVSPITNSIVADFSSDHTGLDFGAGPGPVITKILKDQGYCVEAYDPYFSNYPRMLQTKYDYIACCEVIEHFYNPEKDFTLLKNLLKPQSKLYCMTELYTDDVDFKNWHYITDTTHVFFYCKETIALIKEKFEFSDVRIQERLIVFSI